MFPIKRTVFFTSVSVHKNTVRLIGNIEYVNQNNFKKIEKFMNHKLPTAIQMSDSTPSDLQPHYGNVVMFAF